MSGHKRDLARKAFGFVIGAAILAVSTPVLMIFMLSNLSREMDTNAPRS